MRRKVGMRSWGVVEFGVGVIDDATLLVLRRSRRLQPHCRGDPIVQRLILRRPRPEVKAPPAAKRRCAPGCNKAKSAFARSGGNGAKLLT